MGGVQTFLSIGAIVLFTLLILNVNNIVSNSQDTQISNEAFTTEGSVAQAMMDEIYSKSFDRSTTGNTVLVLDSLTAPASLGPETGEVYPAFNDVDDFNNYTRNDTTPRLGVCRIKVKVNYVDDNNLTNNSSVRTRTKLVSVYVFNPSITDTFKLYRYKSY